MTIDLFCLLILALWTLFVNHVPAIARTVIAGVDWGLSNREVSPEVPAWVERADRAQRNHHDNLAMIAIIILIAHVTGNSDTITAYASITILASRILHTLVYMAGWVVVRSLIFIPSLLGLGAIVWRILL